MGVSTYTKMRQHWHLILVVLLFSTSLVKSDEEINADLKEAVEKIVEEVQEEIAEAVVEEEKEKEETVIEEEVPEVISEEIPEENFEAEVVPKNTLDIDENGEAK